MALSFCLFVCLFVRLSPVTRDAAGLARVLVLSAVGRRIAAVPPTP